MYTHNGTAWATTPSEHKRFVWSGWLMLLELDETAGTPPTIAVRRKQTWGLDLAGMSKPSRDRQGVGLLESAGGIGGLLSIYDTVGTGSTGDDRSFALFYDANGNVGQLLELTAGTNYGAVAAAYEYDAYGNRINTPASGEYEQPWRFSTKWYDAETGLSFYGYRYYAGRMGRWVSRDPQGERGGINLLVALSNNPSNRVDALGLRDCWCCSPGDKCVSLVEAAFVPFRNISPDNAAGAIFTIAAVEIANVFSPGIPPCPGIEETPFATPTPGWGETSGAVVGLVSAMRSSNTGSIWTRYKCSKCDVTRKSTPRPWWAWIFAPDVGGYNCTQWVPEPQTSWSKCTESIDGLIPIGAHGLSDEQLQTLIEKCVESAAQAAKAACGDECP